MSKALTIPTRALLTETGMDLPTDLSYEEWLGIMAKLFTLEKVAWWAIGDGLAHGEAAYGERYAQAMALSEATGINVDTLRKAQWVAEQVPVVRRRTSLSWGHHDAVAALDEDAQVALLEKAEDHELSVSKLRGYVQTYKRALANGGEAPAEKPGREVKMTGPAKKKPPKPKPEPVDEEEHPEYGKASDHEEEIDPIEEWKQSVAEVQRLNEELESLTTTDQAAEIRKLHQRIVGIEGRLRGAINEKNAAIEQVKYQNRVLRTVRDLLGVESNRDIQPRLLELVQR